MPRGRFPTLNDAALETLRSRIGQPIEDTLEPWCTEATRDNIRHYAHGIGDDNPLWCDPAYARTSCLGDLVAPPSFVFACDRVLSGYVGGLPGIHAMWAGADLRWRRWIRRGDALRSQARLHDLVEHETTFAGRAVQQIYHVELFDQRDELLCEGESWCFRTERDTAREQGLKYRELARPLREARAHSALTWGGPSRVRRESRQHRLGAALPRTAPPCHIAKLPVPSLRS
jgi:acyl dehydratase